MKLVVLSGSRRPLAAGTIAGYLDQARRFLAGLTAGLAKVSSAEVSAAVLRVSASVSVATAQGLRERDSSTWHRCCGRQRSRCADH